MRKLTLVLTASLLFVPAALAQKPGAAKKIDPCGLVSKAEIQEATGATATDGVPNPANSAGAACDFKIGGMGVLGFVVRQAGVGETADRIMAELNKRKIKSVEAPGLGDRSFFASHGYGMVQLNTFKGGTYVILTMMIPGAPEAKQQAMAAKLMQKALAKI